MKIISREKQENSIGWYFTITSIILLSIFLIFPLVVSFFMAFFSCTGSSCEFVGLDNYARMFQDPNFWQALKNTLFFLIIQVPVMLSLSLLIASLLNTKNLRFKSFYRTAIFVPTVMSLVATSILFKLMFSDDGIINVFLMNWGVITEPIPWLFDPILAKLVIVFTLLWRWTGYNSIFYLAAMQSISSEIYEAASIDGANKVKQFFYITIPQLKPVILFTAVMSTIGTLNLFDEVMNVTKLGPDNATLTLSAYLYQQSFVFSPDFGYASAIAWFVVLLVAIISFFQFKVGGSNVD